MELSLNKYDISTFSNFNNIKQEKITINAKVDFNKKKIIGNVIIKFKVDVPDDFNRIILDCKSLDIFEIIDNETSSELKWTVFNEHPANEALGNPLIILLPEERNKLGNEFEIFISFSTTSDSAAVQWLDKDQTSNKNYPFMFTQCEAILARTLIPCQDTPSAKVEVETKLTVEKPFRALFSGIETLVYDDPYNPNLTCFEYIQKIPVPTYLIAIACGNLEYGKLSERCGVWTEVGLKDKAIYEFEDTEIFLKTAENYLTPYRWGVYNILVLPFSFPYGGMENPCLTFVTPALLAGDKSMTNVIAHEIAHSWTGNLVTNKDWKNFWMNEGFTTFMERKISELIYGEDMSNLESNVGMGELNYAIESIGSDHSYTSLNPDLTNVDPDDAFSVVPYEKGYLFLYYLEQLVGKKNFQHIMQSYIEKFALKSVSHLDFRIHFEECAKNIYQSNVNDIFSQIDWDTWINSKGYPIKLFNFPSKWTIEGETLANKVISGTLLSEEDVINFQNWHTNVKVVFLNILKEKYSQINNEVYENLRDNLHLHDKYNVEVQYIWYQVALKLCKQDVIPHVRKFLLNNGRMKYIRPVYFAYYGFKKEEALDLFDKNKHIYHQVASRLIEKVFSSWNN